MAKSISHSLLLFSFITMYIRIIASLARVAAISNSYNVLTYGAVPDGKTDSSKAFLGAWTAACGSTEAATIYVPPGTFLLGSVTFEGQCKSNAVTFQIDGVLVAPSDFNVIGRDGTWINFNSVSGVSIVGGTIDGQGASLWACKHANKECPQGTTALAFYHSSDIVIYGLKSQNSQMFHIVIYGSNNARVENVTISAPGDSPNTDGIHVESSSNVKILHSVIGTGDDCISIGPGSSNLWINDITCGPGHGISIGSLGWQVQEGGVENVTVSGASFFGTQNGFRIKTWSRPSNGFAKNITFEHGVISNAQNPIIIDQNYCPSHPIGCPNQGSGVKISGINLQDIHGTSATEVGIELNCSPKESCDGITLNNVNLGYKNGAVQLSCANAHFTYLNSSFNPSPGCLINAI
ncbi:unnamed protein product [Cuscuta campestris]|uniref:Pectate lyase superfamily protein domain-containing protein n=1 Tax=Cuscuta campestris TaxID=132261 RepID=A0A484MFD4_9ASTE|nr:unnamed protein product [Cuscuta campestris]